MRRWPIGTSRTWMHCKMRRRNVASRSKRSRRLSVPIPAFTGGHEPHEHRLITRIWYDGIARHLEAGKHLQNVVAPCDGIVQSLLHTLRTPQNVFQLAFDHIADGHEIPQADPLRVRGIVAAGELRKGGPL